MLNQLVKQMNSNVTQWALSLHDNVLLNKIMFFFSLLGKGGFIFWLLALAYALFYFFKKKDKKLFLLSLGFFVALGITFLLIDYCIKPIVKESRPFVEFPEILTYFEKYNYTVPKDYSFPSGHSTAAFLALSYFMFIDKKSLFYTIPFAILISFSRVFIGAHYLSDVLAGMAIGLVLGIAFNFVFKLIIDKIYRSKEVKKWD